MFPSNVVRQFLIKPQPFLFSSLTKHFSSQIATRRKKPIKFNPRKIKKPHKQPLKKLNIEPKVYKRDTITSIYNILKFSTWDSAQSQLEALSIKWDSYTVTQVLKAHPPMEKAWLFFNWVTGKKSFKHDQYTYTTMLDIFGEAGRISSMMFVFEQMKGKGVKIDVVTYTSLMHWMAGSGDIDGAVELWKEMRGKGCRPTVVSYTAYMKILFDHKRVDEATGVYREMLESGLSPNCYTYTVLMEYLACSGKFGEALEIFDKMQQASVQPDKATCNILMEVGCRTGETWAMMKILQYMKDNFLVLRYPVYLKALEAFKIAGESDMLLRQVNQPISEEDTDRDDKISPDNDPNLDSQLILSLINKHNFIAVDALLTEMLSKCVNLESNAVSTIIGVNGTQNRHSGALLAYEYSMKMGISIDRTAYLSLIGLSIRRNYFVKVVEIVEEMVKQGHSLGTYLNSLLIFRLGCNREPISAAKVFNLLPNEEKSTAEYTALIAAYFSSGNVVKGLEIFKIMETEGVTVALGTYQVMVAGLESCGKVREMEFYLKEKRRMQTRNCSQVLSMEETMCNLLFSGASIAGYAT